MRPPGPAAFLMIAVLAGCGGSEQVSEDMVQPDDHTSMAPSAPPPELIEFVTRTDTVDVLPTDVTAPTDSVAGTECFAIQIGAFREPQNAISFQNLTRERYHLPMSNEFNPGLGLYQIRAGAFTSREAAHAQLLRMQADYPLEYKTSWIVQVKR